MGEHQEDIEELESEGNPTGTICIEYDVVTGQHYYVDSIDGSRWTRITPYAENSSENVTHENDQNDQRLLRQPYRTVKVTPTVSLSPSPSKSSLSTATSSTEKGVTRKSNTDAKINAATPSAFMIPELDLGRPFILDVYCAINTEPPGLTSQTDGFDTHCVPDYDKSLPPAPSRSCEKLYALSHAVRKYLR